MAMSDAEFWDACDKFDWFYEMSDDHSVWRRGEHSRATLLRSATAGQQVIWRAFVAHHYSGDAFGTPKQPKPERPQEGSATENSPAG